mmetsp:Transcript_957/g.3021  ORF Transcript_957/g.3021 Transcript_957/m.3021 type:complete len:255 (+) Transcript_957:490-1254(+)
MIAMSFITMLIAGPDVSLSGSPTVSPHTAALCSSEPLRCATGTPLTRMETQPFSTYFFALSHAPPVFDCEMASCTPETSAPTRRPETACTPRSAPTRIGERITSMPGGTISLSDASVEILMHLAWSGGPWPGVPSSRPGISANWRATSLTMAIAAVPTLFIVIAVNQYGIIAPMKSMQKVIGLSTLTPDASMPMRVTKPPKSASETSAAEPIAKPLPIAAVVLPAASSASVLSRTCAGNSAISAMPPALSQTGP